MNTDESLPIERVLRVKLLEIKDRDVRIATLEQARSAVDRGIHIGGAFSAVVPLVALYYGDTMRYDAVNPTRVGQDLFVLSKGHAVAALASIYADIGILQEETLRNSRSWESILNGHPGPLLPGVHTATGPMGQGVGVAGGLALAGRLRQRFDVYTLTGDGELQEGSAWEAIMFAGDRRLSNLCVIVDNNGGQLDDPTRLHLDMSGLARQFESFGWRAISVDATRYEPILEALDSFRAVRDGRPTAIIARGRKGYGGFSARMRSHKTTLDDPTIDTEIANQTRAWLDRVEELAALVDSAGSPGEQLLRELAMSMGLEVKAEGHTLRVEPAPALHRIRRAAPRTKSIATAGDVPAPLEAGAAYASDAVVTHAMRVFARNPRVVGIDADLSSTSGLFAGISEVDVDRALNVGIAEANMMLIGEAFALLGYNTWVSTFCPFFNWNVLRRIAISQQERAEAIGSEGGWLADGHALDLTFLATAPDFETQTNGATHMGNDDLFALGSVAHLRLITASCPQQLLAIIRWVMEGNRGLVYLRILRGAVPVIYPADFEFAFATSYVLHDPAVRHATIVTSGHEVHEAIDAARVLGEEGVGVRVVDMPSIDEECFARLAGADEPVIFAEQNNGYIASAFFSYTGRTRTAVRSSVTAINTLGPDGTAQFIHSGTYRELRDAFGLSRDRLVELVRSLV